MITILRFTLFFLLAPVCAIVAQAVGAFHDDFHTVDTHSAAESIILESVDGEIFSYDSSGALLQQHKSIDGEDCSSGYQKLKTSGAEQPLFSFFAELVAANKIARTPNEAGVVREFVTETDQTFYRVFTDRPQGGFLAAVPPRSSAFAQEALSLPRSNTAKFIQEVNVPAGTSLRRSRAAPLQADDIFPNRRGGAEQFELLDPIPSSSFGRGRPLP